MSGNVFIAKSVRVDIADSSKIILNDCYIGPETDLISYSGISIGKREYGFLEGSISG